MDTLQEQNMRLKAQAIHLKQKVTQLEEVLEQAQQDLARLTHRLTSTSSREAELEDRLQKSEQECQSLREEKAALLQQIEQLESSRQELALDLEEQAKRAKEEQEILKVTGIGAIHSFFEDISGAPSEHTDILRNCGWDGSTLPHLIHCCLSRDFIVDVWRRTRDLCLAKPFPRASDFLTRLLKAYTSLGHEGELSAVEARIPENATPFLIACEFSITPWQENWWNEPAGRFYPVLPGLAGDGVKVKPLLGIH